MPRITGHGSCAHLKHHVITELSAPTPRSLRLPMPRIAVQPTHPIPGEHLSQPPSDLTARDTTPHSAGSQNVGRGTPYVGVNRNPSNVSRLERRPVRRSPTRRTRRKPASSGRLSPGRPRRPTTLRQPRTGPARSGSRRTVQPAPDPFSTSSAASASMLSRLTWSLPSYTKAWILRRFALIEYGSGSPSLPRNDGSGQGSGRT
jgi:hypothetical protein